MRRSPADVTLGLLFTLRRRYAGRQRRLSATVGRSLAAAAPTHTLRHSPHVAHGRGAARECRRTYRQEYEATT